MKNKPLTFEQTRGTKTYHLPFGKGENPTMTLMVRRMADGSFHAGLSVCAAGDPFSRRAGRSRAFHRLNGKPIIQPDNHSLFVALDTALARINERRPNTVPEKVKWDLMEVCSLLKEAFDQLESNRLAKAMREADELIGESIEIADATAEGYEAGGC